MSSLLRPMSREVEFSVYVVLLPAPPQLENRFLDYVEHPLERPGEHFTFPLDSSFNNRISASPLLVEKNEEPSDCGVG